MIPWPRSAPPPAARAPGRRLFAAIRLRSFRVRARPRPPSLSLGVLGLCQVTLVIQLFLLAMPHETSGEVCIERHVKVPFARNGEELVDAPIVVVSGDEILLDGVRVGSVKALVVAGPSGRLGELVTVLVYKRRLWSELRPRAAFPELLLMQIGGDVPALVVKAIGRAAVEAGYPHQSFLVRKMGVVDD